MTEVEIVTDVKVSRPYILDLTFADGANRRVNVESLLHGEVFEPLKDPSFFSKASIDTVLGTVVWPNGADISPEFLRYAEEIAEHSEKRSSA